MRARPRRRVLPVVGAFLIASLAACDTTEGKIAVGVGAATLFGAHTPTHETEQIYYLGAFDPQDQLPPTVYRVRVHGQSAMISGTKFASGWLPAQVVDSLNAHVGFNMSDKANPNVTVAPGQNHLANLSVGRRLVLFGPEGFREAPKDHRLVIVMGSSPEAFFQAVSEGLGQINDVLIEKRAVQLDRPLFEALVRVKSERELLDVLDQDVRRDLPDPDGR